MALEVCKELGDTKAQRLLDENAFYRAVADKENGDQGDAVKRFSKIITDGDRKAGAAKKDRRNLQRYDPGHRALRYQGAARITQAYRRHCETVAV